MLIYSPLSAYFDDVIPQQPALSNDGSLRWVTLLLLYDTIDNQQHMSMICVTCDTTSSFKI
jgi:hypothetical protein